MKQFDSRLVGFLAGAILLAGAAGPARAQTETVLHSFAGTDGATPQAGLVQGARGNFYGTTPNGGAFGSGTVFSVTPDGSTAVLHSFSGSANGGPDGGYPYAHLIADTKGNFYGTTRAGGAYAQGTVFKMTPAGSETILHSFAGPDGSDPVGALLQDAQGNLYGTTQIGGAYGAGVVFKITPTGATTTLYAFKGGTDGTQPNTSLVRDGQGFLYGTTQNGGNFDLGTSFIISPSGQKKILHHFAGGTDGAYPEGDLIADTQGNLYGVTYQGGTYGKGTLYRVTPGGVETVFYTFKGPEGSYPAGGLVIAVGLTGQVTFYGTTKGNAADPGTVFQVTSTGVLTVLHNFTNSPDGAAPTSSLIVDNQGVLYGTTSSGGLTTWGLGTVFKLVP